MKYGSLKVAAQGEVREYPLDLPSLVVGRAESCDIVLDDLSVARRHARISFDSGRLFIEDLGSAAGSFIEGYRLDPNVPALAGAGQELRFGEVRAWFEAAADESAVDPAIPAPVETFDTAIRASLVSPLEPLEPGGAHRIATVTLANRGRIVDDFALTVEGLPAEWVTLARPTVSLLPGNSAEVEIAISPPRHEFSEAGEYDFSVIVTSGQGGREVVLPGRVEVRPFRDIAWSLAPVRAKREFRILASNRGNSREVFRLEGQDDEDSLRYDFEHPAIDLPPGADAAVAFRVAPRRKPWFGAPSVRPFRVKATSVADENVTAAAMGQLVIHPPLQPAKRGAMFALMFCIAIAVVALAVVIPGALFGDDGGTQTASAEEAFKGVHLCDDEGKAAEQQKAAEQLALSGPPAPSAATAATLGAPFYAQNDARWGDVEYAKAKDPEFGPDWCGSTISQCGCAMTSVATMLAIYGVLETPDGVPLSPQTLNEWFNKNARRTNRGWVSQGYIYGDVIWTAANQLSGEVAKLKPGSRTVRFVRTGTGSEEEVREQLLLGRPVVLEVPGHWIAATGLVGDKIQINDPFYRDRTTLDAYKGKVRSSVIFEPSEDLSAVVITVPADVRVRVTDKDGHEVGTLNTGTREDAAKSAKNEIPGASYSTRKAWRDPTCIQKAPTGDEGTNQIVLPGRREDYKIEVLDTAGGATNVAIHTYDRNGQPTVQVLENPGAVTASLAYDPEMATTTTLKVIEGVGPTATAGANASPSALASASATAPPATATPAPGALRPGATNMTVSAPAGAQRLEIADTLGFALGDTIRISPGAANEEDNTITAFGSFVLATPLKFPHGAGEPIIRVGGAAAAGAAPSATVPPPAPPAEALEPQKVDLACATSVVDSPKIATLICSVRIDGDYTTTRWTINGNVQNTFTGQTALFTSYTQDTSAAIAVSACNRTACKSVATTQAIRFTPLAAPTPIPAAPTPTVVPPAPPAVGVAVICSRKFNQDSHAIIECDALTTLAYTSVTWNITTKTSAFTPVTESDNHLVFELADALPDDDKGFANIDFQATACSGANCEVSPPFRMPVPVAKVAITVLPSPISINNNVTFFAAVTGGEVPAGGQVTFYANVAGSNEPISLDVPTTEFSTFAAATLNVRTGTFPLDVEGVKQIRAQFHGGKNVLDSALSVSVPLELTQRADDVCDSLDNNGDGGIDEQSSASLSGPPAPGCEYPGHGGPQLKDIGSGTLISNIRIDGQLSSKEVDPGASVMISATVSVRPSSGDVDYCENCLRQIYFGIGENIAARPNVPADGPQCISAQVLPRESSVDVALNKPFQMPSTPGRYYVRASSSLQAACGNPPVGDPGTTIALIVVKADTRSKICPPPNPPQLVLACDLDIMLGETATLTAAVDALSVSDVVLNDVRVQYPSAGFVVWEDVWDTWSGPSPELKSYPLFSGPIALLDVGGAAAKQFDASFLKALDAAGSPVGAHRLRVEFVAAPDAEGVTYYTGSHSTPSNCGSPSTAVPNGCRVVTVRARPTTVNVTGTASSIVLGQGSAGCPASPPPTTVPSITCVVLHAQVGADAFGPHSGVLQLWDGPALLGTAPIVNQQADFYLATGSPALSAVYRTGSTITGAHSIEARYCPDPLSANCASGNYRPYPDPDRPVGSPDPQVATPVEFIAQPTVANLTLSNANAKLGTATTRTATVDLGPGGYGNYDGILELYDGTTRIACVDRQAVAPCLDWADVEGSFHAFPLSFLQGATPFSAGGHDLHAVFVPASSANYGDATSLPQALTVNGADTTTTLAAPSSPINVGDAIDLVATVNGPDFGGQAGEVEFFRGAVSIGKATVTLAGSGATVTGIATLSLDATTDALRPFVSAEALPASGTAHQLTAQFVAAGNYASSTSSARSLQVNAKASLTFVTTATRADGTCAPLTGNPILGEKVLLTATVTVGVVARTTFSGSIEFFDTNPSVRSLGTVPIAGSPTSISASLCVTVTPAMLGVGGHTFAATFTSSSAAFAGSSSVPPGPSLTVDPAPSDMSLATSSSTLRLSQTTGGACVAPDCVLLTALITPGQFGAHGGFVQFFDQTGGTPVRLATSTVSAQSATLEIRTTDFPLVYPSDGTVLVGARTFSARYCPATDGPQTACNESGNYQSTPATPTAGQQKVVTFAAQATVAALSVSPTAAQLGSATTVSATASLTPGGYGPYAGRIELWRGVPDLGGSVMIYCAERAGTSCPALPTGRVSTWTAPSTHTFTLAFNDKDAAALNAAPSAYSLYARYTPATASNYAGATSGASSLSVTAATSTTTLAALTSPITVGDAIDLVATVTALDFGGQAGFVEFRRNGAAIAQVAVTLATSGANVTGTATLSLTSTSTPKSAEGLPASASAYSVTAHFLAAGNYAASASAARSLTVNPVPTTTQIGATKATNVCVGSTGNPGLGDKVLLTATTLPSSIVPGGVPIAGTVEFFDTSNGNLSLGTAATGPSWVGGAVTLCITAGPSTIGRGTHLISATFTSTSGDYGNSSSAVGAEASITVDASSTEMFIISSGPAVQLAPAATGACLSPDCVAITAVISPNSFGPHSGYVQFFDQTAGGARLATLLVSAQQATLELRTGAFPLVYLPGGATVLVGDHVISVRYCPATDIALTACTETGNYLSTPAAPTPSQQKIITFQPQTTVASLTVSPVSVALGSATTVTAAVTLAPGGHGPYDGAIELWNGVTRVGCVARVAAGACTLWPSGETANHTFSFDFSSSATAGFVGGVHSLTAKFVAATGGNYASSPDSVARTLTVTAVGSTTTLTLCQTPAASCTAPTLPFYVGTGLDLKATVTAPDFGALSGGMVEFRRAYQNPGSPGILIGSAPINLAVVTTTVIGTGILSLSSVSTPKAAEALPADADPYSITAHFVASGSYAASQSAVTNLQVTAKVTSVTVDATKATGTCTATTGTIVLGDPVVLTGLVLVSPVPGARAISGTVEFRDTSAANALLGTAAVSPNVAGGSATLCVYTSPTGVGAGAHTVSASFVSTSGDYASSTSTADANLVVEKIATTTSRTVAPPSVPEGGSISFTASVAPAAGQPYVGNITGTVEIRADYVSGASPGTLVTTSAALSSNATSGAAVIALAAGAHTITAVYVGDANYATSASTAVNINVLKATTLSLTATPSSVGYGSTIALAAQVGGDTAALGAVDVAGSVSFYKGVTLLGTDSTGTGTRGVNFSLTIDTDDVGVAMTPGSYAISAVYSGNAAYATSNASPIGVQVNAAATTLTVSTGAACAGANATIALAGTVDVCASLSPASFGNPTSGGGAVTFYLDGSPVTGTVAYACGANPLTACGATPMTAKLTLTSTLAFLNGGAHFLTASYSGNSSYQGSSSASGLTITVTPAPTLATVAMQSGFVTPLDVVTTGTARVRVTVAPSPAIAYSPASGTVVLYDSASCTGGFAPIAVNNTYASGGWDFNIAAGIGQVLGPGTHYLAAQFLGTSDFAASPSPTSPCLLFQVHIETTIALSFSADPTPPISIARSTAFTITATLSPGGYGNYFGGGSCGTLVFTDVTGGGSVAVGTATSTGATTYSLSVANTQFTVASARILRATYNGCGAYTAATLDVTVTFT